MFNQNYAPVKSLHYALKILKFSVSYNFYPILQRSSKNPFIQEEQEQYHQQQSQQQQHQSQSHHQQHQQYQQHRDRKQPILLPKELFPNHINQPTSASSSSSQSSATTATTTNNRRPIKLPLRKHHSFHFQPSQTTVAAVKHKKSYKNNGPLLFKPFSERSAFKPITPVPKSPNKSSTTSTSSKSTSQMNFNTPPRVLSTSLKRHMSNVETSHHRLRDKSPNLNDSDNDNENSITSASSYTNRGSNNCDSSSLHGSASSVRLTSTPNNSSSVTGHIPSKRIVYTDLMPLNSPSSGDDKSQDEQIKLKNFNDVTTASNKRTTTQYATLKFNEVNI